MSLRADVIEWNIDGASIALVDALRHPSVRAILPSMQVRRRAVDLGCGNGRDALWLASQGWESTGIDVASEAVILANQKKANFLASTTASGAGAGAAAASVEFLVYDVLQLPRPEEVVHLVWDNTIYCNLRLEFYPAVMALFARLTSPGSIIVVNCGSADAPQLVHGHPRIRPHVMEQELTSHIDGLPGDTTEPPFQLVAAFESVYDMRRAGSDKGGVVSWCVVLRRR